MERSVVIGKKLDHSPIRIRIATVIRIRIAPVIWTRITPAIWAATCTRAWIPFIQLGQSKRYQPGEYPITWNQST
jgi:hypothetical protein